MNNSPEDDHPLIFEWTLNKNLIGETIFHRKKLEEFTDPKRVYGFIKNNLGITFKADKKYDFISFKDDNEVEQMKRYKELYNNKTKSFNTAVYLPKHKWGRVVPANDYLSLSIMRRETRHSLCDGYYIDIDMKNAQPTIIYEISKQNGIILNYIGNYVINTKIIRETIMTHHQVNKDIAKQLPITIMMGGTYDSWLKENDITITEKLMDIQNIENEIKPVMNLIYKKNPQIKKDVLKYNPEKWKNQNEEIRGVMGLWSHTTERIFQEEVIKWLVKNKNFELEKIIPCQDGFMILKNLWCDGIIEDINKVIWNKYNITLTFLNKPFDEKINIPLCEECKDFWEWEDLLSGKKLADYFIELYGDFILTYNKSLYVYKNNRWYDETSKDYRPKLTLFISEDLYEKRKICLEEDVGLKIKELNDLKKILRNKTSSLTGINEIINHILSNAKEAKEDFNNKPFLLGFNNGVYDLDLDLFRSYKFDDYITLSTGYDYEKVDYGIENGEDYLEKENGEYIYEFDEEQEKTWRRNRELKEELINIINDIHPDLEVQQLYLQVLASGLDGRAYQKLFLFNGQGGNGKGLTGALMDKTLGDYYHQPGNGIIKDVEKANVPSPDMINLKNKRYINFKEVQGAVRVAMLRNLTGGGKFSGRYLNQNPQDFYMTATFVMEFNSSPDLDGKPQQADRRRLVDMLFNTNFTDDETKINKEIGGVLYKKSNEYYTTQEFIKNIRPIFLDLLLGVYRHFKDKENGIKFDIPESIIKRTEKFLENQNLFQKVFNSYWKKVDVDFNNKEDIKKKTIQVKDIWESILNSQEYKNLTYREKRSYGRDECYKWLEGLFTITGNSKTGKQIIGLEASTDCDEEEEE